MKFRKGSPIDTAGTSLQGVFDDSLSIDELTFALGIEPVRCFEAKITVEWILKFDDGLIATIYDYKGHRWHVGGHSKTAFTRVVKVLNACGFTVTG